MFLCLILFVFLFGVLLLAQENFIHKEKSPLHNYQRRAETFEQGKIFIVLHLFNNRPRYLQSHSKGSTLCDN